MLRYYKDELICDLAETYGILEYSEIKGRRLATLVCGLRPYSRLVMAVNQQLFTTEELLLASIADATNLLYWSKTQDATTGSNRPESILKSLLGNNKPQNNEGFDSVEDFELARKKLINKEE